MINQIIGMNALLLLQTDAERSAFLRSISSNTTATSSRIIRMAQERQNEYTLRNRARQAEYEEFLAKVAEEELQLIVG